jgi:hypothetical protein
MTANRGVLFNACGSILRNKKTKRRDAHRSVSPLKNVYFTLAFSLQTLAFKKTPRFRGVFV